MYQGVKGAPGLVQRVKGNVTGVQGGQQGRKGCQGIKGSGGRQGILGGQEGCPRGRG